ncbi:MAG: alpha-glucosidase C-terminal domain-containing protein, partial [Chitinophagaceae bacterium]|nr:alpha-glucosidase C-terminal domain-containing protein [Chitinophagaceae bacterium]
QQYYWHRFFHHQPDLNYDSLLVQEEVFKIIDYWCELGVDGFRLDAVPYLYEREGTNGENLPETHVFLKKLRKHVDEKYPSTVLLAEANMWPEDSASYFGDGDECHMNYHFPVMPRMFMALQMEDRYPITDIFDQTPAIPETCQWAIFLRNHDELTLEMVTDEERDYMYKAYAKDPKARINLGIRHRLAPLMDNNRRKIELLNCLLFSLPGTPVIYYGDEIGMGDNFYLGDRDGVRTPMQWSADRNAGFSASNPQKLYLPLILDPEYHYESVNVESQRRNTSSLFWFMKRMIHLRKKFKAFGRGDMKFINIENPKVLVFTRTYLEETLLFVVNLSKFSQAAEVDLLPYKGYVPVELSSKNRFPIIKEDGSYFFTLGSYAFESFMLEKVHEGAGTNKMLPSIQLDKWSSLLSPYNKLLLESGILPDYLMKSVWFTNQERTIHSVEIINYFTLPLPRDCAYVLLVEVVFERGLAETYQVILAMAKDGQAATVNENYPQAVVSKLSVGGEEAILCDGLYIPDLMSVLLKNMASGETIQAGKTTIKYCGNRMVKEYIDAHPDVKPRIYAGDPANTSIGYDNSFFLKIYRKVDKVVNADLEITRFLTDNANFEHVPAYMGSIEWNFEKEPMILGMLQTMIENHGNGHTFMLERINNYIERVFAHDHHGIATRELAGTLIAPVGFDELPDDLKELLGARTAEQARLIGMRTADLHRTLASGITNKAFQPEEFSLHYQRSLFSAMQSLVRETFDDLQKERPLLHDAVKDEVRAILGRKNDILQTFKRIYSKKLDAIKIRIHGNYHLGQVLLTGKDVSITDFGGNPLKTYSERRLKRSPLRDATAMMRSFYYVAYEGVFKNNHVQLDDVDKLIPYARLWAHYMSGFFMKAYLEGVKDSLFIPEAEEDVLMMVQTYFHRQDVIRPNTLAFGVGYEGKYGGIDGRTSLAPAAAEQYPV